MNHVIIRKTEVLVVFVCLFVSSFCFYALGYRGREHAKQIVCAANIRLNSQSMIQYAADHEGLVTFNYGLWPHDMSFSGTDDLMQYGSTRPSFYCPANKTADAFNRCFWQYAFIYPYDPYTDFDESYLTLAQKQQYFRILSYLFLTDNPSRVRATIVGTPPRDWIRDLDEITNPQEYEMMCDQTISEGLYDHFYGIISGGLWSLAQVAEQSNHLNKAGKPLGGNIGFVDGHVAWRPFDQMQIRAVTGINCWW